MMHFAIDRTGRPVPQQAAGFDSAYHKAVKQVAIVEDELMVALTLEAMLEELGHQVVGLYARGEDAVPALLDEAVDMICMDINLGSGIDGVETARRLRERQPATILFISAYSDAATKARIADLVPGATLLTKPLSLEQLERAIADSDEPRH